MSHYYALEGHVTKPCDDITAWSIAMSGCTTRHVGDDTVSATRVSTVFLGIDHSLGDGPPLLFETMLFGGEHDGWQYRYTTWEQAEAGHKRIVTALQAGVAL